MLPSNVSNSTLEMADDRNLTAHTYNEGLAKAIFGRLARHGVTLSSWLDAIQQRMAKD